MRAWVRGEDVTIWAGTQSQGPAQGILGQVAQVANGPVRALRDMALQLTPPSVMASSMAEFYTFNPE